jgi:hypothetical protein
VSEEYPNPHCEHCGREMQLNTAVSTEQTKQFLCYHDGVPFYLNVHRNQKGKYDLNV